MNVSGRQSLSIVSVVIFLMGFYLWRAAPTVTIGDSAELAAVGGSLGIAHSPGYPLYSIITHIGCAKLRWGGTAYRTNVQSAFWGAATAGVLILTLLSVTGSWGIALITGGLLGCAPMVFGQALVTEVFALNSFLGAVVLYVAIQPSTVQRACLSAYLLGLGIGNNQTLILLSPAVLVAAWPTLRREPVRTLGGMIAFGLLGLSVYLFIPIRAQQMPVMNWEEPSTLERFWKLFIRARYGAFQIAQGDAPMLGWNEIVSQAGYLAGVLWQNSGPLSLALVIGLWDGIRREKIRQVLCLAFALFFSGPFFLWLSHLPVTLRTRTILDRFLYLPLVPAGLLIGLGLYTVTTWLQKLKLREAHAVSLIAIAGFLWLGYQPLPFERTNFSTWDLGHNVLRNTPPNTLLFADRADEVEFTLAYLQRMEHQRPDVSFIDCNAGVSTSIYGPNYYDVWGRPRLATRTVEERSRIAAWNGPVFYATHDPQMIPITRTQTGLLFQVDGKGVAKKSIPWDELFVYRKPSRQRGRLRSWDRGLYADYLEMLAQDAFHSKDMQRGVLLYRGADAHARS